ncbi:MAG: response regulator [Alteromonadaceae bacterium]|nr:response regulator [Alteromonadaceae bacterium]
MLNSKENNLLIIEDDIAFANTLMRRLSKYDYHCEHAIDSNQALLSARRIMPAIVLLDMKLADESGLNLIKPLRNLLPKSKILLLTGFASIATAVDAIKLGADDYLAKPLDTKTLLSAIKTSILDSSLSSLVDKSINVDEVTLSTEQVEWQHIQQVLKFNKGNVSATARQLSMHRRTLQRKLQKKPKY